MDSFSEDFKTWMDLNQFTSETLAPVIGKSAGTIANWRSIGVPERRSVRAFLAEFMANYTPPFFSDEPATSTIRVEFSDEDLDLVSRAAGIVDTPLREFIRRSAVHRARESMATRLPAEPAIIPAPESVIHSFTVRLLRAAAGIPILADAEPVEVERELGKGRFLLELRGDSMAPRFRDKQRVILRDKATLKRPVLRYGDFYCFVHNGAAAFKQWAKDGEGRKVLRSLNAAEHPDIPADEDTDWIGWFDPKDNR